ncbi:MAG: ATP synthase F1 subunit epsilon [Anaerovoracaceae bacterium]
MPKTVAVEVITPSKLFYNGDVEIIIAPTKDGAEGFMANHSWTCTLLAVGELWIKEPGSKKYKVAAISNGFIDVKDTIILYTDAAEWAEDIDVERAMSQKEEAEDWLIGKEPKDPDEVKRAQLAIAKSIARMKAKNDGERGTYK